MLDLPHFPFVKALLQNLELFLSSQGSSIPHRSQVFLQFFLHDLDFRHFFALHFLLHFFMGQLSSQPVVGVVVGGVVVPEKVHNNSINCTGCLSTQLPTTQSYNRSILLSI